MNRLILPYELTQITYSIDFLGLFSSGVQRQRTDAGLPCCAENICAVEKGSQCNKCVYVELLQKHIMVDDLLKIIEIMGW
jgi:hypothetical protein